MQIEPVLSDQDFDVLSFHLLLPPAGNPLSPSLFLRASLSVQNILQTSYSISGWPPHHSSTPTSKHRFLLAGITSHF